MLLPMGASDDGEMHRAGQISITSHVLPRSA